MKETRYFFVPNAAKQVELPDDEAVHAVRVLRMQAGDEMMLMDGQGAFYRAVVTLATQKRCQYEIVETLPQEHQWKGCIHLAIAPTKLMDRIEWMAEKATEVGLDKLSFLDCAFSERKTLKLPRIEKIVVSAVKQSRKAYMPELTEMTPFKTFIQQHTTGRRYIAHCYDEVPRVNLFDELKTVNEEEDALVMIGPEGDFSIDEVRKAEQAGFVSVSLGKSRLRTETAALVAAHIMHLSMET